MLGIELLSMFSVLRDLNAILKHWLTMTDTTSILLLFALGLGSLRRRGSPANRPEAME